MAIAGSWRIYGAVTGLVSGTRAVDVSLPVGAGVESTLTTTFPTGFTGGFGVPTNGVALLIIPPPGNVNTITLKGVTGDTGIALHPSKPTLISVVPTTTFGITVSAATVLTLIYL